MAEVKQQFVKRLKEDFPELRFVAGRKFMFRPARTVVYEKFVATQQGAWREVQSEGQVLPAEEKKLPVVENNLSAVEKSEFFCLRMLHEVGHAVLGHKFYATDVDRLKMERAAWEKARELCPKYGVEYIGEFVEEALDSYRDWLHQRSKCPKCGTTRFQDNRGNYVCPGCYDNFVTK